MTVLQKAGHTVATSVPREVVNLLARGYIVVRPDDAETVNQIEAIEHVEEVTDYFPEDSDEDEPLFLFPTDKE